ncbi:MAG: DUF4286 family protein [Candidatus Obscuribacter sp.]|nr:DUF4286 family protein [Candidatus Melainabacteria bacterium]MDX1988595.1 DUF4286 family protein [Candidatus Obscuribacter sp.]
MIIYEVNLEVDESIKFKYAGWLPAHIEKMMTMPGFMNAYWFFREPQFEGKDPNKTLWTIQYFLKDQESLDQYLNNQAKAMRQEALDLFGAEHFKAERRVLYPLAGAGEVNT